MSNELPNNVCPIKAVTNRKTYKLVFAPINITDDAIDSLSKEEQDSCSMLMNRLVGALSGNKLVTNEILFKTANALQYLKQKKNSIYCQ